MKKKKNHFDLVHPVDLFLPSICASACFGGIVLVACFVKCKFSTQSENSGAMFQCLVCSIILLVNCQMVRALNMFSVSRNIA